MSTIFNKSLLNRIRHRLNNKRSLEVICKELQVNHNDVVAWLIRKDSLSEKKQQLIIDFKLL